jgi:hypothetical protein
LFLLRKVGSKTVQVSEFTETAFSRTEKQFLALIHCTPLFLVAAISSRRAPLPSPANTPRPSFQQLTDCQCSADHQLFRHMIAHKGAAIAQAQYQPVFV